MSIPFDSPFPDTDSRQESAIANDDRKQDANGAFCFTDGFCDQIAPQATRYAMSILRVWADAEEVVQEAFCRLLQSDRTRSGPNAAKAILFTTVRNLAIDCLRRKGRQRFELIDAEQIANNKMQTSESRLRNLEAGVQEVLRELPVQWSDAIQLKINGGLSYDEIANVLNATHAQVRTWIYRARKQLEKDLADKGLLEREE